MRTADGRSKPVYFGDIFGDGIFEGMHNVSVVFERSTTE